MFEFNHSTKLTVGRSHFIHSDNYRTPILDNLLGRRRHALTQEHGLLLIVNLHLLINCLYTFVDGCVTRILKIIRCLIVALYNCVDGFLLKYRSPFEMQEIKTDYLVKELMQIGIVV